MSKAARGGENIRKTGRTLKAASFYSNFFLVFTKGMG